MATKKKKKKLEIPEQHFDSKEGKFCVYEIYRKSKKTVYFLRGAQSKHIDKITLEGYEGLPSGLYLYKDGFGLGKKGTFFLKWYPSKKRKICFFVKDGFSFCFLRVVFTIVIHYRVFCRPRIQKNKPAVFALHGAIVLFATLFDIRRNNKNIIYIGAA